MDFWDVLQNRRSVREFDSEHEVPAEVVEKLLEAGTLAPTAGDRQPWHFVIVRKPSVKEAIARTALRQEFIAKAPVVIVICGEPERSGARRGQEMAELHTVQDTSAATENILLAATALGLGSCWVSALREEELSQVLNLPATLRPIAILPIGYPAKRPGKRPPRRPLSEISTHIE